MNSLRSSPVLIACLITSWMDLQLDFINVAKVTTHYATWRQSGLNNLQIRQAAPMEIGSFSQNHRDTVTSTGAVNIIVRFITTAMRQTGIR